MEPITIAQLARQLYDAYGQSAGWKNFQGNPMPTWEELPNNIRANWSASARECVRMAKSYPTLLRNAE